MNEGSHKLHLRICSAGDLPVIGAENSDPYMARLMFETGLLLTQVLQRL